MPAILAPDDQPDAGGGSVADVIGGPGWDFMPDRRPIAASTASF